MQTSMTAIWLTVLVGDDKKNEVDLRSALDA